MKIKIIGREIEIVVVESVINGKRESRAGRYSSIEKKIEISALSTEPTIVLGHEIAHAFAELSGIQRDDYIDLERLVQFNGVLIADLIRENEPDIFEKMFKFVINSINDKRIKMVEELELLTPEFSITVEENDG